MLVVIRMSKPPALWSLRLDQCAPFLPFNNMGDVNCRHLALDSRDKGARSYFSPHTFNRRSVQAAPRNPWRNQKECNYENG